MEQKSRHMLRALINSYYQGSAEKFLDGLPKEEIQQIISLPLSSSDAAQAIVQPQELFAERIHYSWTAELIEPIKDGSEKLFIASLPDSVKTSLNATLKEPVLFEPASFVKQFFLKLLAQKIGILHITPMPFLPHETLTYLTEFNKEQLVRLIDFLALYDLAEEIKTIVDKNILQKIYNSLSMQKQQFLRMCLHQKERFSTAKMGLVHWQGNEEQLTRLLHRRGLLRLSYALSGHHADLIWYIAHRLDTGRGRLLEKNYTAKEIPGVTVPVRQQVVNIVNFFKKTG